MASIFWFLAWGFGLGALAYHKISLQISTASIYIALLATYILGGISGFVFFLGIILATIILVPLNMPNFRREYITSNIYFKIKNTVPKMSDTEREALEAGTVWWDKDLFCGSPNWSKLLKLSPPKLSSEEQAYLDGPVEKLCNMLDDWDITNNQKDVPKEVWDFLKKEKFFAFIIPKSYGGLEFSALAHSEILAKVAGRSLTVTSVIAVPNSLGPAELLLHYGTEEQKNYYLPKLATGEEIPCFALTNPEAGSDATSIPDYGIVCKQNFEGKETLGIKLNWDKRYITLAPVATVLGLAFQLYDPDKLLGDVEEYGITCALIPVNTKGITIGRRHMVLNTPFPNGPTQGKDVFIPIEWIIGGPSMAGKGWKMLVDCLSAGRAISLPSTASGGAKLITAATGAYARIRKQFKVSIGKFEGIEEVLAKMASRTYLCEAARQMTAMAIDSGEKPSLCGAINKAYITEYGRQSAIDAMDVHGGKAIIVGPRNYVAHGYENVPVGITVEGANILTRNMIIFGQGALRCHPFAMQEMQAILEPEARDAIKKLDTLLFKHAAYTLSNAAKAMFYGITNSIFAKKPVTGQAAPHFAQLARCSAAFAFISDFCMMIYGGKLKFKESISARLADQLAYMYLTSSALKRFIDQGEQKEDATLLKYSVQYQLSMFWQSMDELLRNMPNKFIGYGLRFILMPFGKPINTPTDRTSHKVASMLITPCETRSRLIAGSYLANIPSNHVGMMELAFELIYKAEPLEKKVLKAQKEGAIKGRTFDDLIKESLRVTLITTDEAELLRKATKARFEVITVDDFSPEEITGVESKNQSKNSNVNQDPNNQSKSTDVA